ncbi:hypothetical protein MA16_Dca004198 [Dendrobium catenatum]|uniref:Uncharacterized protein n=1 Tax=Dendrobium catenatum TaxID=906689 RepID=A0A2I0W6S5_9ASPA|nr:hypothetical protein MA16_Dca004198 [Dendrobium catenatum]
MKKKTLIRIPLSHPALDSSASSNRGKKKSHSQLSTHRLHSSPSRIKKPTPSPPAGVLVRVSIFSDLECEMISSTMATNPEVCSLLSSTVDVWLLVITATADQRRSFSVSKNNYDQQEPHDLLKHGAAED